MTPAGVFGVCVFLLPIELRCELTRCGVVDRSGAARYDRRDAGRRNPRGHVQQGLDDVTLEDGVLLPQIKNPHNLALQKERN